MRRRKSFTIAIAAAVAVALTLAGCTAGSSSSAKGKEVINVGWSGDNVQQVFNPYLPVNAYASGSKFMIYEPLVQIDKVKSQTYLPWLAKSWTYSPDSKSVTFTLQPGVKWSDGKPFTSADVVYSYELLKKDPALNLTGVEFTSISAPNPTTVVMNFATNARPTFTTFANIEIVPQHIWSKVADPTKYNDADPVGTGPFELDKKSFTPQSYELTANPNYWQKGKPAIGGLRFINYKDNNSVSAALVQGDIDWSSTYIADIDQTYTAKGSQFKHFWPVIGSDGLITNNASKPFDDLKVRQAVSDAINRKQVAASANRPAATNPVGLPLPLFENSIAAQFKDSKYVHSLSQAKQILESDGYTAGSDGTLSKDGKPLSFTITIPSSFTEQIAAAQVIQANLKQVGIKVSVDGVSTDAINPLTQKGQYQATIGYPINEYQTPYALYSAWMNPKYYVPVGTVDETMQNIERWNDPATAKYFSDYDNATTDAQRNAATAGLESRFVNGIPWIVLSYYQDYGDYNDTKVTGFPTASNPYYTADPNEVVAVRLKPTGK
jgi:peptide/nickel transport system substrate-binding protein